MDRSGEHWLWMGGTRNGYGQFVVNGKNVQAHRFAYELLVGPIPEGKTLDHLCRIRRCVRAPRCLEPVTNAENIRRGESGANQRVKTHCPQGHPYDATNTYINPQHKRQCRVCHVASSRRYAMKARALRSHKSNPAALSSLSALSTLA